MGTEPREVTLLLMEMRRGSRSAEAKLIPLIYKELRRLASHYLRQERPNHTLQPTALVHEAYMRLVKINDVDWQDRSHFFATAATVMRRILVDHARAQQTRKREGLRNAIDIDQVFVVAPSRSQELLALDEALDQLHEINARQSKIVELRFFAGLSEQQTGAVLGISTRTVKRDWRFAKAWLYKTVYRSAYK